MPRFFDLITWTRNGLDRLSRWRFLPEVPYLAYLNDLKLVFIVTTVYTSLVSQFRHSAISETERDISSESQYKISDQWPNHSIQGGVSDSILWQCRTESDSRGYYHSLYGGLFGIFFSVITLYFVFRLMIVILTCKKACTIKYPVAGVSVNYLVLVANSLKKVYQLKNKLFKYNTLEQEALITYIQQEWQREWKRNISGTDGTRMLVRWISTLYVIPMFENLSILLLLILILTSYDIHPIGCLLHIDVAYDDVENTVSLQVSETVRNYQKVAVVSAVVICIVWLCLKFIQSSLLPDVHSETDFTLYCKQRPTIEEQLPAGFNSVVVAEDGESDKSCILMLEELEHGLPVDKNVDLSGVETVSVCHEYCA